MPVSKIPGAGISGGSVTVSQTAPDNSLVIDSSGNVGIGTSSPAGKLGVSDGTVQLVTAPFGAGLTGYFGTSTNHALAFLTNNSERMRIDSSGNVGIGTSSPTSYGGFTTLAINNSSSGGLLDFVTNGTVQGQIFSTASEMRFTKVGANFTSFYTNGSERMRIDASGRVTKPFQPAFSANGSGGTVTISAGSLVPFNNVIFNIGSNYNGSTYLFTAPVTGVYWFNYSVYIQGASSITPQLNGAEIAATSPLVFVPAGDQYDQSGSASLVIQMSAGDTFGIRSRGTQQSVLFTPHSRFSGYLLG